MYKIHENGYVLVLYVNMKAQKYACFHVNLPLFHTCTFTPTLHHHLMLMLTGTPQLSNSTWYTDSMPLALCSS